MIRDNRRINIQTNFYDDEQYFTTNSKPHEQTFQTNLLNRDRGAIALYNILDTIRLHRIVNAFQVVTCVGVRKRVGLRKHSSKDSLGGRGQGCSQETRIRYQPNEPQPEADLPPLKVNHLPIGALAGKRSDSLNSQTRSQGHHLRNSRKRILQSISKKLHEETNQGSVRNISEGKKSAVIGVAGKMLMGKSLQIEQQDRSRGKSKEKETNLHLKTKLQKLQRLMINIRRQKQTKQPKIVHQKRPVPQMPKKQHNHAQMRKFMQEILSLRQQMHELKIMNEQILQHSRERSSSKGSRIVSRSDSQGFSGAVSNLQVKNIKRSEFLGVNRSVEKPESNSSEKGHQATRNGKKMQESIGRGDRDARNRKQSAPQKNIKGQKKQQQPGQKPKQPQPQPQKSQQIATQSNPTPTPNPPSPEPSRPQKTTQPSPARPDLQQQPQPEQQQTLRKQWQWPNKISNIQPIHNNNSSNKLTGIAIQEQYRPFNEILDNSSHGLNNSSVNGNGNRNINKNKYSPPLPPKPTSSQTRRLDLQYKSSQWYREYGPPSYNNNNNIPFISNAAYQKPSLSTVGPLPPPNPHNLQLLKLHQIKDAISNSNANSSRTSNLNSRTSSPRSYINNQNTYTLNSYGYGGGILGYGADYDGGYVGIGGSSSGVGGKGDSDYTNPNLLKQLNIGPFPKLPNKTKQYDYDTNYNNYSYKYDYQQDNPSRKPPKQQSLNMEEYLKNLPNVSNPIVDKMSSFKTISDTNYNNNNNINQLSSYTYSKGSSQVTSMAKLEQEYQHIINDSPFGKRSGNANGDDYPSYEAYNFGGSYEGITPDGQDQPMNMKKLSSLEDQVNSYFANNHLGGRDDGNQYYSAPRAGAEGTHRLQDPDANAYRRQFYDKYS